MLVLHEVRLDLLPGQQPFPRGGQAVALGHVGPARPRGGVHPTRLARPTDGGKAVRPIFAAAAAGVARCVVLGSHLAAVHRARPQWRLAERHPYIAARLAQTERAFAAGGDVTQVSVLEVPPVFGTYLGRRLMWRDLWFDHVLAMPVPLAPRGRSSVTTPGDVAAATLQLAEGAVPAGVHPLDGAPMTLRRVTEILAEELGVGPVVTAPDWLVAAWTRRRAAALRQHGRSSGLDCRRLAHDVLTRDLHLPARTATAVFDLPGGDVEAAVRETVRAAYPTRCRPSAVADAGLPATA